MFKTPEVVRRWVDQEGDRFSTLLTERGFLRPEDEENREAVRAAARAWRETYLQGIQPESLEWRQGTAQAKDILDWRLGGWNGWKSYRLNDAQCTTFRNVVDAIDAQRTDIPHEHLDRIPTIAKSIKDILETTDVIVIKCQSAVAVLEGTHRMSALAYAVMHQLPIPENIRIIETTLPESKIGAFNQFCENLPVVYGPYKTKH